MIVIGSCGQNNECAVARMVEMFLLNTEEAIKNGQSRETSNIGNTRRRQTKQKHNTICVGHHNTQPNIKVLSTEKKIVRRVGLPVTLHPWTRSSVIWLWVSDDELVARDGLTVADGRLCSF
jgi:hypothetical protein